MRALPGITQANPAPLRPLPTVACSALLAILAPTVHAADQFTELEEIVVTGQKTKQTLQETTAAVSVISGEQLAPAVSRSVYDALDLVPNAVQTSGSFQLPILRGVDTSGGQGSGGTAAIAGARPRATTYVDGVPMLQAIGVIGEPKPYDVQQIEVYRGSQSTVLGRNSYAGAIVVTTKDPTFDWHSSVDAAYSDRQEVYSGGASISGPILDNELAFRLSARVQDGRGFVDFTQPGFSSDDLNPDNYETVRGKLLWQPAGTPKLTAKLTALYEHDERSANANLVNSPDPFDYQCNRCATGVFQTWTKLASTEFQYQLNDTMRLEFTPSFLDVNFDYAAVFLGPSLLFHYQENSRQWNGEGRFVYQANGSRTKALAGVTAYNRKIDTVGSGIAIYDGDDQVETYSVFTDITKQLSETFDLLLGGRLERESQQRVFLSSSGNFSLDVEATEFLPKLGFAAHLTPAASVGVVVSKGYSPAGGTLSFPSGTDYTYEKEYAWLHELFVRTAWLDNRLILNGTVFYTRLEDYQAIEPIFTGFATEARVINLDRVNTYGLEAEMVAVPVHNFVARAGIGILKTKIEDDSSSYDGNSLVQSPEFTANLGFSYTLNRFTMNLNTRYVTKYYGELANLARYQTDAFFLADISVDAAITDKLIVSGYVKNALDEQYLSLNRPSGMFVGNPRTFGIGVRFEL